jgi:hypothetical protein
MNQPNKSKEEMMRELTLAAIAVASTIGFAGTAEAAITASNVHMESAKQIVLDVDSPEPGWAVIHVEKNGHPAAHIGHAMIGQGMNKNVMINLKRKVQPGEKLIVMLHNDKGKRDVFEFGKQSKADTPAMQNGKMVTTEVTVQ